MNGRNVAFFDLHCLAVNELPGGIWIVIKCEFLTLSAFLHDKSGFKQWLFCIFWYLHSMWNIRADAVRTKVKQWQIVEAQTAADKDKHNRIVDDNPLVAF